MLLTLLAKLTRYGRTVRLHACSESTAPLTSLLTHQKNHQKKLQNLHNIHLQTFDGILVCVNR